MAQAHDVTTEAFSEQSQSQEIANTTTTSETAAVVALASKPDISPEVAISSQTSTPTSKRRNRKPQIQRPVSPSPTPSLEMTSLPLLICSIGNPGAAYANTLHSAGHTVLQAMATLLQTSAFSKDRNWGNGMVTRSYNPEIPWTLWQSTSYMNESGKGVNAAYRTWQRELVGNAGRIVVLHDEMEKPLGSVSVRDAQGLSAKGHNGIKSCLATLGGNVKFVRVGVGIGRPVSRSSEDVSRFVLKKMTAIEKGRIEEAAVEVIDRLMALKG